MLMKTIIFAFLVVVIKSCEWNGIKGRCVLPSQCLTTLDRRNEKPPVCPDEKDKICCTDCNLVNDTSNFIMSPSSGFFWKDGRKARDACLQYLKDLPHICHQEGFYAGISRTLDKEKKCHMFSLWGIGGSPPPNSEPPSETPYEALMGFGHDVETALWMAAGAIISERFILTSAHGHFTISGKLPLKYAAVGVKNRKSDKKNWQVYTVKKIHKHPEFEQRESSDYTRYDDIALLELESPITFTKDILPACLPEPSEEFDITTAKFNSWKEDHMPLASFLDTPHLVYVQEITPEECDAQIREMEAPIPLFYERFLPEKIKSESQLCYGNNTTCLNVIGAPLVVTTQYSRCMNTVIGVNTYGDACGPTVSTKVKHYTRWIEDIVWP